MRTSTSSRATCIWALSLALLASTTGCAQLMKSGTDLIAAGPYGAQGGAPDRVAAKPSAHRRPDTGMTSAYRVAPTRWMNGASANPTRSSGDSSRARNRQWRARSFPGG